MIQDYFKIAFRNLKERKARSILTLLGIFLAIVTIFVLISLSLGLNDFVQEQFELLGTDKFFIQPKGTSGAPGTQGAVELTTKDVDIIRKTKGVDIVAYFTIGNAKIGYKDQVRYYFVMGIPMENPEEAEMVFEASDLGAEDGRMLKKGDSKKILIGYNYKYKNLFDKSIKPGDILKINDVEFEVIGVVEAIGNPGDDQQTYITLEDYKKLFDSGDKIDFIYVQIKHGEDVNEVAERAEKKLMDYRDVDEKTIDFDLQTPEQYLEIFNQILLILTTFLVGIGLISILVGGIGIANTMYTSVLERTKEIGTMKAIGARNSNILKIFVIESGLLGLIGGILGLFFGILIAKTIEYVSTAYIGSNIVRASLNPFLVFGVLVFAFFIGILSGLAPSYQASKLKPVDALRHE